MSPLTLFFYAIALAFGVFVIGLSLVIVVCVYFYLIGGIPPQKPTSKPGSAPPTT